MPMLHPPFAHPGNPRRVTPQESGEVTPETELPSIERFLDDLPPIDDFLLVPAIRQQVATPASPVQTDDEGWAAADWQSYDWSGLARLGAPEPEAAEAHAAWSSTSWDSQSRKFRALVGQPAPLPHYEVAAALDEIARRIRTGELSLEEFRGTPPEAAIAALLAAFLRNKG